MDECLKYPAILNGGYHEVNVMHLIMKYAVELSDFCSELFRMVIFVRFDTYLGKY